MIQGYPTLNMFNNIVKYTMNPKGRYSDATDNLFKAAFAAKFTSPINSVVSRDFNKMVSSLKLDFSYLEDSLNNLNLNDESEITNSSPEAVEVQLVSEPMFQEFNMSIQNTAEAQINETAPLSSSDYDFSDKSSINIKIEVEGKEEDIEVDNKSYYNNESTLKNIAEAINKRNIGVKAEIIKEDETVALRLSSQENSSFKFNVESNIDDRIDFNNVIQEARDAEFTINGEKMSSKQNNISVADMGISMNLLASIDQVEFSIRNNYNDVFDNARQLADAFTTVKENLNENNINQNVIVRQLDNVYNKNSFNLKNIGISRIGDELSVDEAVFTKSLEDDFNGTTEILKGFKEDLKLPLDTFNNNPVTKFVDDNDFSKSLNSNYLLNFNNNNLSLRNIQSTGILIDILF